jgi:hypothetical protein
MASPVVEHAQPQQNQHRAEVLDGQRHPDLQPVDGQEVRRAHPGQADDPEEGEPRDVLPPHPQQGRPKNEQRDEQKQPRQSGPQLGKPQRAAPSSSRYRTSDPFSAHIAAAAASR